MFVFAHDVILLYMSFKCLWVIVRYALSGVLVWTEMISYVEEDIDFEEN